MVHKVSGAGGCVGKSCKQHGQRHKPPQSSKVSATIGKTTPELGQKGVFRGVKLGLRSKKAILSCIRRFDSDPRLQNFLN